MQYRYIEFKDKLGYHKETDGKLWYVGEPTEELIKELELKELKRVGSTSEKNYCTTLSSLGEKGWNLQFVSPCGAYMGKAQNVAGPIENLYIFSKEL